MTLGQQVATSLRQTALWRFGGQLVTWVATLMVMRLLGPEDYGIMAMALMPVMLLTTVADLGLAAAVVQAREISEDELRQVLGTVLISSLVTCLAVVAAAPVIAWIYGEPRALAVMQVLALILIAAGFTAVPEALMRRKMQFGMVSKVDFAASVLGAACALTMASLGWGVWSLVAGALVPGALKAIVFNVVAGAARIPEFSASRLAHHLRFGRGLTGSGIAWTLYYGCDAAIIGSVAGSAVAGLYSVGKQIGTLPSEKLMPLVNQILFRAFATIQTDEGRVAFQIKRIMRLLLVLSIPMGWGMASVAPEIVRLVLGPKWVDVSPVLQAIGLILPFWMIGSMSTVVVQGLGHANVAFRSSLTGLALLPAGFLIAASWWGLAGAAAVWLVLQPIVIAINLRREFKFTKVGFTALAGVALPALISGLAMLSTVAIAGQVIASDVALWIRLAVMVGTGVLTYVPLIYILDRSSLRELKQIART